MNDEISYISKEAALAIAKDRVFKITHADGGWHKYRYRCIDPDDLRELPAADVREVVHGRWEELPPACNGALLTRCTACRRILTDVELGMVKRFCPNCGAKMDLEAEE